LVAAFLFLLALFSCAPAFAQANTGDIWGHVTDTNGDIVADASVSATNVDTRAERSTRSNSDGRFGFGALPPGHYQVTVSHGGFAAQRQDDIVLLPGHRMQIELRLHSAVIPETIAVNPYPPILESGRTHASGFVTETEIEALPIEGQRYLRLAELIPAVTRDFETGGVRVMDLPSAQNRVLIDGLDHTSSITGEPFGAEGPLRVPYQLSQWSVEALRVQTNGAPAENGRAGAAVISVATKPGANAFRGSGYEFFGDRALNGVKTLDQRAGLPKPPYRSNQFGAIVGGPMLRNHDFFLLSYEGLRRMDSPAASPDLRPFAAVGGAVSNRVQSLLTRASADQEQDLVFVRTDHDYFGQHLTLRYLDQQFAGRAIDATHFQPALASDGLASLRTRSGAGSVASAIGGAVVNEARVQYADSHDTENPPSAPALVIWNNGSFVAQTGSSFFGPHRFATKRLQIADSISWVAGAHSIKAGVDFLEDRNETAFGPQITYGFQSIDRLTAMPASGASDWVTQTLDTGTVQANVNESAAFLQDAWRASDSLTIDLGIRYDVQDFLDGHLAITPSIRSAGLGSAIATARSNWAPRIGFAYAPGARKTVFRGAYGLFYGTTPALIPALAQAFTDSQLHALPASIAVVDPSFKTSRVHQATVGWEAEKYRMGTFGVDYLFARGERLPRPVDVNIAGRFPGWARVVSFQSSGQSLYNGISAHTRGRLLQQLFYTIAYTFAHSTETPQQPMAMVFGGLNERGSLSVQGNMLETRAAGDGDHRHQIAFSAMYDTSVLAINRHGLSKRLISDWEWGLVYTLQTGRPFSAYVYGDINGDRNAFNDLAPDTTWNQYRLPYHASFDPRIARRFQLGGVRQLLVIWEAFNISNRPNYTAADNTLYSISSGSLARNPLFGRTQANGRMMQLAARFVF
jgi:Carboxypeptidase regulatory-like domain/TonB dependent receptor-like, beta-barrel